MIELLQKNRPEIEQLCRRHHVRRLELFGSAVKDNIDKTSSDIDLLVEFESLEQGAYADHYFDLLEDLQALLGMNVDLVVSRSIKNPYFLESVKCSSELLYAA
jgi:hypothetical protein